MPRAALLSIHARVEGVTHTAWEDPALVQVWGPRYQVYVVAAPDHALFTLARLPESGKTRAAAEKLVARLEAALAGERMGDRDVGTALGGTGPSLRYATLTGRLLIRWEGARAPHVWIVPPPTISVQVARHELARRYLNIYGPSTAAAFAKWGGIGAKEAATTFDELGSELVPVRTPAGDAHLLDADVATIRQPRGPAAPARLLPSGDAYWLHGTATERALLVPDEKRRGELWTPRVWPGRSWSTARSSARGAVPSACSRSSSGRGSRASHGRPSSPRPRGCRCPTRGRPSCSSRDEDAARPCDRQPRRRRQGRSSRSGCPTRRRWTARRRAAGRRGRRSPTRASTSCATTTRGRPAQPPSRW